MSPAAAPMIVSTNDMTKVRSDKMTQRQEEILSAVDGQDVATFKVAMSDLYGVSVRTIERDLVVLETTEQIIVNGCVVRS